MRNYINQSFVILLFINSLFGQGKPNIVFAIADDWGPDHAGAYGDPVVKTPNFDRIASEGILFNKAYVTVASCTPSRASTLAGQMFWRLGEASNLFGNIEAGTPLYPKLLEDVGYFIGHIGKGCGPACVAEIAEPAGPKFNNINAFFNARPNNTPFCFWLGTSDPHRGYQLNSGENSGMNKADVVLPPFWPDVDTLKGDVLDYYFEVQRFDKLVGDMLTRLESEGELDNTLIIMTSDHAMPFPRFKSNSYEFSNRVPFAVRWGSEIVNPGRKLNDYISFQDLAPTFLEAAGVPIPQIMTGKSIINLFKSNLDGNADPTRNKVFYGKNKHTENAPGVQSYVNQYGHFYHPQRVVIKNNHILIWNLKPDEWPVGPPPHYPDVDKAVGGGWGPSKAYFLDKQNDPAVKPLFDLNFGKRPEFEVFDLAADPWHMNNIAGNANIVQIESNLKAELDWYLCETGDTVSTTVLNKLSCDSVKAPVFQVSSKTPNVNWDGSFMNFPYYSTWSIKVFDFKGKLKSSEILNGKKWNPKLKPGVYHVRILESNKKFTRRVSIL